MNGQVTTRDLRSQLDHYLSDFCYVKKQAQEEGSILESLKIKRENVEEAQKRLQFIAQNIQQATHRHIASVVTRCLEAVFDGSYTFSICFEKKRGKTEAQLMFLRDSMELDPLEDCGGGVVDIAQLALKLSRLMLFRPKLKRVLIMDEPFRAVHGHEKQERLKSLLLSLANDFDVQFIIATGLSYLKGIGKEIEI